MFVVIQWKIIGDTKNLNMLLFVDVLKFLKHFRLVIWNCLWVCEFVCFLQFKFKTMLNFVKNTINFHFIFPNLNQYNFQFKFNFMLTKLFKNCSDLLLRTDINEITLYIFFITNFLSTTMTYGMKQFYI